MTWIDLDPKDLAQVSYRRGGMFIDREPGPPVIVADAKPRTKAGAVLYLRVPMELHMRLANLVEGSQNVAVVAIIEEALQRLEDGGQTWRVLNKASGR